MRHALAALVVVALSGCVTTLTRSELAVEYYNIGTAYLDLGQHGKGADYLVRAIELDPALVRASYNLARAYAFLGRHAEAIALLEELLSDDPENTRVMETLGYVEYGRGDLDRSAVWYGMALERSPANVDLLLNLATIAMLQDDPGTAAVLLERARRLAPQRPAVAQLLLDAFDAADDVDRAVALAREMLEARDDDRTRLRYAGLLVRGEFYGPALVELERISSNNRNEADLRASALFEQAAILLTAAGEPGLGLDRLGEALALGFRDAERARSLSARPDLLERSRVMELIDPLVTRPNGEAEPPDAGSSVAPAAPGSSAPDDDAVR